MECYVKYPGHLLRLSAMFRALRRQVPRIIRPFSSRNVHSFEAPYIGPPSYETIRRRFTSPVNPREFFYNKRQQDARDRGEFIDIHDVGGVDPQDFDVLITDVDDEKLRTEIAEEVGIQYLVKATEADSEEVVKVGQGYLFGRKHRTIFPCVVSHEGKARWVFLYWTLVAHGLTFLLG